MSYTSYIEVYNMIEIGSKVDNVIDGKAVARNCKVVGYHEYDKSLVILYKKGVGKWVASIKNCVEVNK